MKHTRDSAIAEVEVRRQAVDRLVDTSNRLRSALDDQIRLLNLPGADKAAQSDLVMAAKARLDATEAKVAAATDDLNDILRTLNNPALLRTGDEIETEREVPEPVEDQPSPTAVDTVSASLAPKSTAMPKRARGKK